jgi:putative membrane protein
MNVTDLPAVNASLNALSGAFLVLGYIFIRRKNQAAHIACMVAALIVSVLFLGCYVYYHFHAGSTKFTAEGPIRYVYFTILLSHTILAMLVALWMVPVTVIRALRKRYEAHKSIARWTFPVWLYVSVTGVLIYFMLYHWYAPSR